MIDNNTQQPEQEFIQKDDSTSKQGFRQQYHVWGTDLPKPLPNSSDSKSLATICHLSLFLPFPFLPIAIFLLKKDDPFVTENAKEDINFFVQFAFLGLFANALKWFLGLGYLLSFVFAVLYILGFVYMALGSSEGKIRRYPFIVRWIK
jgi:uncharacterized Tic20 family protein